MNNTPICMAEEYWANTHLSVVRYYGGITCNEHQYIIVNDRGMDLWECTHEANKLGREKAIPPGEPADLLRQDFQKYYKMLGRDKFLDVLKEQRTTPDKELHKIYKEICNTKSQ